MKEESVLNEMALAALRHDLRNSIGQILGYGEMVMDDLGDLGRPDLIADVGKIHAAGKLLLALVDERLHVASLRPADALIPASIPQDASPAYDSSTFLNETQAESEESGLLLVVDDNEDNRDILARRLQKQGHWAVTASSGQEALDTLADQPFDVVLLDIMMPDMDGYEVLSRIKADSQTQRLPVIMISALDEMDSVVRCIEMGAADYLPKPFNPTLLRARVGASLREKRARDRELRYTAALTESYRKLQELERLRDDLTHNDCP